MLAGVKVVDKATAEAALREEQRRSKKEKKQLKKVGDPADRALVIIILLIVSMLQEHAVQIGSLDGYPHDVYATGEEESAEERSAARCGHCPV